jgi:ABC-type lipoprotein release transport system permease subunit
MLFRVLIKMAWRNLRRNPRRTVLTALAVSIGLWSSLSLAFLGRGVSRNMADQAIAGLVGHLQIHRPGYLADPTAEHTFTVPESEILSSVGLSSARVRVPAMVSSERSSFGVTLVGIDPSAERRVSFFGNVPLSGAWTTSSTDSGVVIGKKLAELLETQLGRRIVLLTQRTDGSIADRGFRITGIFDSDLESWERAFVFTGLDSAAKLSGANGAVTEVSVRLDDEHRAATIVRELNGLFPDLEVKDWTQIEPLAHNVRKFQSGILLFLFLIVMSAVSIGLVNALVMAVIERVHEFGLLQSIGMRASGILRLVLFESLLTVGLGALAGNLAAAATFYFMSGGMDLGNFSEGAEMAKIGRVIYPEALASDCLKANLILAAAGLAASLYPALRAVRLAPLAALRRP